MRISYLTAILLIMPLLLCGACSSHDAEPVVVPTAVTVSVKTVRPENNATDDELINTWWMAFVDDKGIVRLILDRPSEKTEPVDYEEFHFSIPWGKYTVYAFANIDRSKLEYSFTEGSPAPDLTGALWNSTVDRYVPMSGKCEVSFSEGADNRFSVEVVRLWAKLGFEFTTDRDSPVTVSKISMTPAKTHAVTLLPDYSSLGGAPVLPEGMECSVLERTTDIAVTKGNTAEEIFYVLESTASSHPTGHYPVTFELSYGDGNSRTVSALAYQLEHINRNDYVTIPVLITDWFVGVDVQFYPPIGGYPAVVLDTNGDEYFARFGSSGRFVVRPTVTTAAGTVIGDKDIDIIIATSDPSGILSVAPARDEKTYEITGEIGTNMGVAVVDFSITVKTDALEHTILRKLYIIRQNS